MAKKLFDDMKDPGGVRGGDPKGHLNERPRIVRNSVSTLSVAMLCIMWVAVPLIIAAFETAISALGVGPLVVPFTVMFGVLVCGAAITVTYVVWLSRLD